MLTPEEENELDLLNQALPVLMEWAQEERRLVSELQKLLDVPGDSAMLEKTS